MRMPGEEVLVLGVGMVTAVGLSSAETAASARAGAPLFVEINWRGERFQPFKVAQVPDDGLPPVADGPSSDLLLSYRETRLLRLGLGALAQCAGPLAARGQRVGLSLALPDRETLRPLDRAMLLRRLAAECGDRKST